MPRFEALSTEFVPERAILVGVDFGSSAWPLEASLSELERLVETDGATVVATVVQKLSSPSPRTFVGSGKVEEISSLVRNLDADVVVFDDELSPSQQSNLERLIGSPTKVIDRTALILDIFGRHARTREGRLQVQIAQLKYLLPRLRGMWTHLAKEQTRGGIGSRFGQGESQLEIDRRMIRDRISSLNHELKVIEKRRETQSKTRSASGVFRIALVGYTNAGKSTLLNALTGSDVYAKDELFATLDPTTRSLELEDGRKVVITDTVGFIQKLPTTLVQSFKSTLGEAISADLIIVVADASDPKREDQIAVVRGILVEIGAGDSRYLTVYNKADLIDQDSKNALVARNPEALVVSAMNKEGLEDLLYTLLKESSRGQRVITVLIPYEKAALTKVIHENCQVLHEEYRDDGVLVTVRAAEKTAAQLEPFVFKG